MSCKDYQQYIQQWFNYVLDAHVARCESCTAFFLQLTQTTANDLERLQAVHAVAAHAAAEAQGETAQAAYVSPPVSAAPSAVPQPLPAPAGSANVPQTSPGASALGQPRDQSPAYNQAGVVASGQSAALQSGQHGATRPQGQGAAQGQANQAATDAQSHAAQAQGQVSGAQISHKGEAPQTQGQSPQAHSDQSTSQANLQTPPGQTQHSGQAAVQAGIQQVQQAQPFPKISRISPESIPKLAPNEGVDNSTVGRLFEIGKFILSDDDRDILKRMTSDEPQRTGVKILSHRDSESLQAILGQVSRINTVLGWVIISNDGLLIYSTLPEHFDAENIAVRALSIFMGSEDSSEKCGFGQLRQVVMRTAIGTLVISHFSGGLFVTVATANDAEATVELIQQIRAVT